MQDLNINDLIIKQATKYIGQEEYRGNMGFKDPEFDEKMRTVGFVDGYAWCALFTELVWREAYAHYDSTYDPLLNKLFSAGVMNTYRNFQKHSDFEINPIPKKGSLVVWQKFKNNKPTWYGHIGIVHHHNNNYITTIEGNTNDEGGREGYKVDIKKRPLTFDTIPNGLILKGFIHPKH